MRYTFDLPRFHTVLQFDFPHKQMTICVVSGASYPHRCCEELHLHWLSGNYGTRPAMDGNFYHRALLEQEEEIQDFLLHRIALQSRGDLLFQLRFPVERDKQLWFRFDWYDYRSYVVNRANVVKGKSISRQTGIRILNNNILAASV